MSSLPDTSKAGNKRMVEREIRRRSIVSFSVFFILLGCGYMGWSWLYNQAQDADGVQPTLRKGLETNEKLFSLFYI